MTVVVLGAGVIGVTTAWYLAQDGHEVVVVDRQPEAGLETSFANGALVTPSMSDPWAAPGAPGLILRYLGREDAPMLLRLRALPGLIGWGLRFLANCAPERWRTNTETVLQLGLYSRDALDALSAATGIAYHRNDRGNLRVYRDAHALEAAEGSAGMYLRLGLPVRVLNGVDCATLEPALRPVADRIAGGVHYPADRSGDALAFTQGLAQRAASAGVQFRFDTTIAGFETAGDRIEAVATDRGRIAADRFVLACGSWSAPLGRRLALRLPVRPVKGYSATLPLGGWNAAPAMPVIDYLRKMATVRLGDRIRLAGTAEFAGYDNSPNPRRGAMLLEGFAELFPEYPAPAADAVEQWSGLRPMTPDGRPILGTTRWRNLYLNTGHGSLGWTLACGSARALASVIGGRAPDIDISGFRLDRF